MANIYAHQELREEFWKEPIKVGKRFGIDEKTSLELAIQNKIDIERYGQILINKRVNAFASICPLTAKWLGNDLLFYFQQFSKRNLEDRPDRYAKEAYYFAKFLQKQTIFKTKLSSFQKQSLMIEWLNIRTENLFLRWKFLFWDKKIEQKKIGFYLHCHIKGKYFKIFY